MEGLRSFDRKSRELQVGRVKTLALKTEKLSRNICPRNRGRSWGRQRPLPGICQVSEPQKTTLKGMSIRKYKQQQQKFNKITSPTQKLGDLKQ